MVLKKKKKKKAKDLPKKKKNKKKKRKRQPSKRSEILTKFKKDEENRFAFASEKAVKIYGAALASSVIIGALVYLFSLLPWTKWDEKDGIPRYDSWLFVRAHSSFPST